MENLIKKAFGIPSSISTCKTPHGLPFYLINDRKFYSFEIAGISVLLVVISETEKFGVVAFEKQLKKYMEASGSPTAFVFPSITKVQRDALAERMIPFICLPDQIFLPFLGIELTNRFIKRKLVSNQKMTPMTQALFLYFLYKAGTDPVIKKQAAEDLKMTRMSVSRASDQLQAMGLISQETHGKEIWMRAIASGRTFYESAKPFLISPVQRTVTAVKTSSLMNLVATGETALSMHTMLNSPVLPIVAVDKKKMSLQDLEIVDEKWHPDKELIRVEFWKYNPELFMDEGSVDPVSLAESLRDIHDERVQGELEDYLEGLKW